MVSRSGWLSAISSRFHMFQKFPIQRSFRGGSGVGVSSNFSPDYVSRLKFEWTKPFGKVKSIGKNIEWLSRFGKFSRNEPRRKISKKTFIEKVWIVVVAGNFQISNVWAVQRHITVISRDTKFQTFADEAGTLECCTIFETFRREGRSTKPLIQIFRSSKSSRVLMVSITFWFEFQWKNLQIYYISC